MIKTLQKRFVFSAMLAVTILLAILLGVINVANTVLVHRQTKESLQIISENDGELANLDYHRPGTGEQPPEMPEGEVPPEPPAGEEPGDGGGMPQPGRDGSADYDTFMSSNFFVIRIDSAGEVTYTDVSRTGAVSEEEAQALALEVLEQGKKEGKTGNYRYKVSSARTDGETTLVFLDDSSSVNSYLRVLLISAAVGVICWIFMLLVVRFLSGRAIRPIAENIEKQKQFITNAGHDLKTPLAIISANAEAMELYNGENKWSKNIREQTLRLSDLMNNLLLLSRMDENGVQLNKEELDLTRMAEGFGADFAQPFENRQISFTKEIEADVRITADRSQTERLLSLLFDNALKYADEGGRVKLSVKKEGGKAVLVLENSCTAVPEVPPGRLFDRFYRSDKARTQKNGGFGIGLAVAQSICTAQGGSITAEYLDPPGVRFRVVF